VKATKSTRFLEVDTFGIDIPLFENDAQIRYFLKNNDIEPDARGPIEEFIGVPNAGLCQSGMVNGYWCLMVFWPGDDVSMLVHELHHATDFLCERIGVTCMESKAYIMQHLFRQAVKGRMFKF